MCRVHCTEGFALGSALCCYPGSALINTIHCASISRISWLAKVLVISMCIHCSTSQAWHWTKWYLHQSLHKRHMYQQCTYSKVSPDEHPSNLYVCTYIHVLCYYLAMYVFTVHMYVHHLHMHACKYSTSRSISHSTVYYMYIHVVHSYTCMYMYNVLTPWYRSCEEDEEIRYVDSLFTTERPGIGVVLIYMAVEGVVFFILTLLIEVSVLEERRGRREGKWERGRWKGRERYSQNLYKWISQELQLLSPRMALRPRC